MSGIRYLAVLVAAVAAFVASSVYYTVFGNALVALLPAESVVVDMGKVPAWKKAAEFVRGFIVAFVVAYFVAEVEVVDWKAALRLALVVWVGFPFHDSHRFRPVGQQTLEIRRDSFGRLALEANSHGVHTWYVAPLRRMMLLGGLSAGKYLK